MVKVKVMMPSARFQEPGPRALAHAKPLPPALQPLPALVLLEKVKSPVKFAGAPRGAPSKPAALPELVICSGTALTETLPRLKPGRRASRPASVKDAELPAVRAKFKPSPLSGLAHSIVVAAIKRGVRTTAEDLATRLELASRITGRTFFRLHALLTACRSDTKAGVREFRARRVPVARETMDRIIRPFFRYLVHFARLGSQLVLGKKCRILHNYYPQ